jgi:hypothetical protein
VQSVDQASRFPLPERCVVCLPQTRDLNCICVACFRSFRISPCEVSHVWPLTTSINWLLPHV